MHQPFGLSTGRLVRAPVCAGLTGAWIGDAVRALDHRDSPQGRHGQKALPKPILGSPEVAVQFAVHQVVLDELVLTRTFVAGWSVVTKRVVVAIALELATARRAVHGHG